MACNTVLELTAYTALDGDVFEFDGRSLLPASVTESPKTTMLGKHISVRVQALASTTIDQTVERTAGRCSTGSDVASPPQPAIHETGGGILLTLMPHELLGVLEWPISPHLFSGKSKGRAASSRPILCVFSCRLLGDIAACLGCLASIASSGRKVGAAYMHVQLGERLERQMRLVSRAKVCIGFPEPFASSFVALPYPHHHRYFT